MKSLNILCASAPLREKSSLFVDLLLLAGIEVFMMCFLDVRYLFYDTVVTGGDTASWHGMANHLLTELLPHGRLTGWDMGNFCGYPNFSFYFLPPFLLAALPSWLLNIPLTITLKIAIASGIFLFPVMTYLGLRNMGYRFPGPIIGAAASLLLLFNELYTMFGGNVLSTLTGEFSYMFAFALFAWFIGSFYRGMETEKAAVKNGILLGLIGLSHLFVFVPAVCLAITLFLYRGKIGYLFKVSLVGFGLMAFWILPLLAYRHPYTTPVYMIWQEYVSWRYAFMGIGMILLFVGPRFGLAALGEAQAVSAGRPWGWAAVGVATLGSFILFYVGGSWLVLGKGLFDHGLNVFPLSLSPIGASAASFLQPYVVPVSLAAALIAGVSGIRAKLSPSRMETFSYAVGGIFFIFTVLFASIGFHVLVAGAIPKNELRTFFLSTPVMVGIQGTICLLLVFLIFFRISFKSFVYAVISNGERNLSLEKCQISPSGREDNERWREESGSGTEKSFLAAEGSAFLMEADVHGSIPHHERGYSSVRPEVSKGERETTNTSRFVVFLGLSLGCIVLYFAAHYLQVPDIRFLPPLGLALLFVLFADTLEPFLATLSGLNQSWVALAATYGVILIILFGTVKADTWFRFNSRGYEHTVGSQDFKLMNIYLRKAYPQFEDKPLNAPRVGYEKCSLYEPYGGDRVFESMPFFAGRQTMEGIHYASTAAAKFTAFLQSVYSNEVKTPRAYILSRMNAAALPAYFNLYNISELILLTKEGKESIETSPEFEKKVAFGNMTVYRYKNSDGRYVDVPRRRPLLYGGNDWVEEFYRWYREGKHLDLLMVPAKYVKHEADRPLLGPALTSVDDLPDLRSDLLDRRGLQIETEMEHQRIRFTTNRVGVPHLVKVSYFPNWKVEGAYGVYPVSPHLMMVIPRQQTVTLTYGRNPWEVVGSGVTGLTLLCLIGGAVRRRIQDAGCKMQDLGTRMNTDEHGKVSAAELYSGKPKVVSRSRFLQRGSGLTPEQRARSARVSRLSVFHHSTIPSFLSCILHLVTAAERFANSARLRQVMIGVALLAAVGLITGGAIARNKPVRAYIEGFREYKMGTELRQQGKESEGRAHLEKAIRIMAPVFTPTAIDDHQDVILCMLFTAACHENLGEWSKAEPLYWKILNDYPFSRYAGEAYVKIGRVKRQQGKGDESAGFFEKAMREDPWSVWAKYAKEELGKK